MKEFILALKPRAVVTRSPKQGYYKTTDVLQKIHKKSPVYAVFRPGKSKNFFDICCLFFDLIYLLPSPAKVMFLHVSVILATGGGGGIPACLAGGIPAYLAAGLQGSACSWGVCSGGCGDPPKRRRLLLRTVRILLECILVLSSFSFTLPLSLQMSS